MCCLCILLGFGAVIKKTLAKWGQQVVWPSFSRTDPSKYAEPGPDMIPGIGSLSSNDHSSNANIQTVEHFLTKNHLWWYFSDQCGASKTSVCRKPTDLKGVVKSRLYHFRGKAGIADDFCFCTFSPSGRSTERKSLNLTWMRSKQTSSQETRPDTCVVSGDSLNSEYGKYGKNSSSAAVTIELPEREMIKYVLTQLGMHVINLTG